MHCDVLCCAALRTTFLCLNPAVPCSLAGYLCVCVPDWKLTSRYAAVGT